MRKIGSEIDWDRALPRVCEMSSYVVQCGRTPPFHLEIDEVSAKKTFLPAQSGQASSFSHGFTRRPFVQLTMCSNVARLDDCAHAGPTSKAQLNHAAVGLAACDFDRMGRTDTRARVRYRVNIPYATHPKNGTNSHNNGMMGLCIPLEPVIP